MRALRLTGHGAAELQELEDPLPADDEVVIRVERAGVCGTDVEILNGDFPARPPVTMGHEYAGVVGAVGSGARRFSVGDRVTSAAAWSCGRCERCAAGQGHLCAERQVLGSTVDGAFAEAVRVPQRIVHPLPPEVTADDAQSMVAVAVCLRALGRVPARDVGSVAVSGPGHVGLILLQLLLARLGRPVTMFGTRERRLDIARALGADTVNVRSGWRDHAGLYDLVFETAGTPSSFMQALDLVAPGGAVCVLGTTRHPVEGFSSSVLYEKEITLIGSKGGSGEYAAAIDALATGEVSVAPLISHRFPLADARVALQTAIDRESVPVRVVIEAAA